MKRGPKLVDLDIKNAAQPNRQETGGAMKKDVELSVEYDAMNEQIEDEFHQELSIAFTFDGSEEEDGALECLESVLFGENHEKVADTFQRMKALEQKFKDCTFEPTLRMVDGMLVLLYEGPEDAFDMFRCGKLPDVPFTAKEIPAIFAKEIAIMSGIKVSPSETSISWDVRVEMNPEDYDGLREYFLHDGLLGWHYAPKTRMPGERWRQDVFFYSHEVAAVCQRIKTYDEGFLTVKERLTRWGIVMHVASRIRELQCEYSSRPVEWKRVLLVLDVCEDDVQNTLTFTNGMHALNPIEDLIPIRVLEVITVFRILSRLSLQQFELAYTNTV